MKIPHRTLFRSAPWVTLCLLLVGCESPGTPPAPTGPMGPGTPRTVPPPGGVVTPGRDGGVSFPDAGAPPDGSTSPPQDGGAPPYDGGTNPPPGDGGTNVCTRGTALGGNANGVHGCQGYEYNHYEHCSSTGPQLHVIGIYEGVEAADGKRYVDVQVHRAGSSVLVLSAYRETYWRVAVAAGARVERILVTGYDPQHVAAPAGTPIESHSYAQTGEYLGGFGYEWPSYRTTRLIDQAEARTGAVLTSFRGCYTSASFQIDEPGALRPPHPVSDEQAPTLPAGCESLARESTYCLSLTGSGTMSVIGLDSGRVCQGGATPIETFDVSSLGWQGDYYYACIRERGVARVSIVDGTADIAPVPCEMATTYEGGILATLLEPEGPRFPPWRLVRYAGFETAARGEVAHTFALGEPSVHRIGVHRNRLYYAWHSTNTVQTVPLQDGATATNIPLANYDNWIFGLDATDDGKLLVMGGWTNPGLYVFDAASGAHLRTLAQGIGGHGLACKSGGAGGP
jgi:hypothetical protein